MKKLLAAVLLCGLGVVGCNGQTNSNRNPGDRDPGVPRAPDSRGSGGATGNPGTSAPGGSSGAQGTTGAPSPGKGTTNPGGTSNDPNRDRPN